MYEVHRGEDNCPLNHQHRPVSELGDKAVIMGTLCIFHQENFSWSEGSVRCYSLNTWPLSGSGGCRETTGLTLLEKGPPPGDNVFYDEHEARKYPTTDQKVLEYRGRPSANACFPTSSHCSSVSAASDLSVLWLILVHSTLFQEAPINFRLRTDVAFLPLPPDTVL